MPDRPTCPIAKSSTCLPADTGWAELVARNQLNDVRATLLIA